jgi:probable F420-dependent oxidoreductase
VGRVGVWLSALGSEPARVERNAVARLEALDVPSLWIGETPSRKEPFTHAALLLAASERIAVGLGVAGIWARDVTATQSSARSLAEAYPGRFVLGLGVSHRELVRQRGHAYEHPVAAMRDYLDRMTEVALDFPQPEEPPVHVLGAIRPQMLALAAERADGAITYLMPPNHTAFARKILGARSLLAVEQTVVVGQSAREARDLARRLLGPALRLANYRQALRSVGFEAADLAAGGSDALLDALVAAGDIESISTRVHEQLEAGADHVAIQPLATDIAGSLEQLETLFRSSSLRTLLEHTERANPA